MLEEYYITLAKVYTIKNINKIINVISNDIIINIIKTILKYQL